MQRTYEHIPEKLCRALKGEVFLPLFIGLHAERLNVQSLVVRFCSKTLIKRIGRRILIRQIGNPLARVAKIHRTVTHLLAGAVGGH